MTPKPSKTDPSQIAAEVHTLARRLRVDASGESGRISATDAYRLADIVEALSASLAAVEAENARLLKLAYIDPEHAFEDTTYQARFNEAMGDKRAVEAERDRLKAALQPFGELAYAYDPPEDDDHDMAWDRKPSLGQLRAARAALTPQHQPSTDGETR